MINDHSSDNRNGEGGRNKSRDGVMGWFANSGLSNRFSREMGAHRVRERILSLMILIGTGLAAISFVPGAILTLREGLWPVFAMNTAVLLWGILLLGAKGLGYRSKAWTACLLIYAVGAYVIFFFGFLSGGPIWLFAFGVMTGLLLGIKAAVIGIVLNAATLLVFIYLQAATSLGQGLPFFASWLHCLTAFGGFVLMNTVTAISCSLVLEDEAEISLTLRREKSVILESKRRLEQEIVSRKKAEEKQRELARELEFLHKTALEFMGISEEEPLYRLIGRRIREILGDVVVVMNSFEAETRQFRTLAVEGMSSRVGRILDILGRSPVGMISTLNDETAEQKLKSGRLVEGPTGIHELSFGAVPKPIGRSLEKLLGIRRIYVIGFVREGDLFGSAVVVDRTPDDDSHFRKTRDLVEAYVNQAALALLRNRFEKELRESEARYRQLVNSAPAGIYEIDLQNHAITNVNDVMCGYTGYTKEEFLALNPADLLTEESLTDFVETEHEVFAENDHLESKEYRIRRKDGSNFWARGRSNAAWEEGSPVRATVVMHDVTEVKTLEDDKRRLQESLLEARKMEAIATLAGGIAHQFNNALSVVSASMDMLELDAEEGREYKKYIEGVKAAVQKMTGLTSQLLAYARRGKYVVRIICLSQFVAEVLPAILSEFSASVQVETDLSPEVLPVEADPKQMKAVLSAILTNSVEAMEEGGTIRIVCENQMLEQDDLKESPDLVPGAYIVLTIEDTGKGMDEETRQKIFDPFFTTKFQGRGLAMPAVLGIVKNHGGMIDVESVLGKGTTVRILFPAFKD